MVAICRSPRTGSGWSRRSRHWSRKTRCCSGCRRASRSRNQTCGTSPSCCAARIPRSTRSGFVQLIRHVLGVAPLERWSTVVTREFERFIAAHTAYTALQIRFLQTLRTFILQRRRVERRDLVEAPFTQLHPQGIRGVFPPAEIDSILGLTHQLVA